MTYNFGEGYKFLEGDSSSSDIANEDVSNLKNMVSESIKESRHKVENPIMTCVGTISDFGADMPEPFKKMLNGEIDRLGYPTDPNVDNVSYRASYDDKEKAGLLSGGPYQYVMSPVDSKDKYSSGFYGCLGLVVVGTDKESGQNISMMLHTPLYNQKDDSEGLVLAKLVTSLDAQLKTFNEKCADESVDSIFVGGLIQEGYYELDVDNYNNTKDFLVSRVKEVLGFMPSSVGGPKILTDKKNMDLAKGSTKPKEENIPFKFPQSDDIYFENKTRRLFLLRPEYTKE